MLRKSWKSYKAARREGYADRCLELEHRINSIRAALGIEECSFGWAGVIYSLIVLT